MGGTWEDVRTLVRKSACLNELEKGKNASLTKIAGPVFYNVILQLEDFIAANFLTSCLQHFRF